MILLTGATGLVGSALLNRLIAERRQVRVLVRDPRRLGPNRVRVQITLGDLADPFSLRQAVRGVTSVVHLAAAIRDQPGATIEELNGLATIRLLRAAEHAKVERFMLFGALGATPTSSTRFFRSKALAERAVLASELDHVVLAPSLVYAPGDPFLTLLGRMSWLPWMPVAGAGDAAYQPIWAEDVAACALAAIDHEPLPDRPLELAGPEVLSYEQIAELALAARAKRRPIVHVPFDLARRGLDVIGRFVGPSVFAKPEELDLLRVPMTTLRGTIDARSLGVEPASMRTVLGLD